jgi:hypothetical protein
MAALHICPKADECTNVNAEICLHRVPHKKTNGCMMKCDSRNTSCNLIKCKVPKKETTPEIYF